MARRAAKVDATQEAIVSILRQLGCSVTNIKGMDGTPDLIAGRQGVTHLIEVKTGKAKLRPKQERFRAEWRGAPVVVLRSADEAIAWIQGKV